MADLWNVVLLSAESKAGETWSQAFKDIGARASLTVALNEHDGLSALLSESPSAAILVHSPPALDAIEAVLKFREVNSRLPMILVASDSDAVERSRAIPGCHAIWLDDAELFRENAARTLQQILGAKSSAQAQPQPDSLGATAEIIRNSALEVAGALQTIETKINELGPMLEAVGGEERAAAISIQAAQRHAAAMNSRILQASGADEVSLDRIKFHDILRGAVRLLQQERSAGFSPELRFDAEKTEIEANSSQLSKALHSLLGAWASLYGGSRARMAIVTDNGSGSAGEARLRIAGRGAMATGPEFEPDADLSTVKGRLPVAPRTGRHLNHLGGSIQATDK